jgi:D-aspartate ligase
MPGAAIVLGGGISGLAVARSLGRQGVAVHLVADGPWDIAGCSRFAQVASVSSTADDAALVDHLLRLDLAGSEGSAPALFFTSDRYLRLVTRYADRLSERFAFVAPTLEAAETVIDKARWATFAEEQGISAPRSWIVGASVDLDALAGEVSYPVVLKPQRPGAWLNQGVKMLRANDPEALRGLWQAYCGEGDTSVIQQYIEGPDDQHYAYYAYRSRDGIDRAVLTVRKERVYPIHAGDGVFAHVVDYPLLEQIGGEVLNKLGYVGAASVCFKVNPDLGPLIYEINGRLPAMHGSFALVGVDLPYLMYADATGVAYAPPPPKPHEGKAWIKLSDDLLAGRDYWRTGELSLRRWIGSYNEIGVVAEAARDDLRPLFRLLVPTAKRMLTSRQVFHKRSPSPRAYNAELLPPL